MSELLKEVRLSSLSTVYTYEMSLGIKRYGIQFVSMTVLGRGSAEDLLHSGATVVDLDDSSVLEGQEKEDILVIFESLKGGTVK